MTDATFYPAKMWCRHSVPQFHLPETQKIQKRKSRAHTAHIRGPDKRLTGLAVHPTPLHPCGRVNRVKGEAWGTVQGQRTDLSVPTFPQVKSEWKIFSSNRILPCIVDSGSALWIWYCCKDSGELTPVSWVLFLYCTYCCVDSGELTHVSWVLFLYILLCGS